MTCRDFLLPLMSISHVKSNDTLALTHHIPLYTLALTHHIPLYTLPFTHHIPLYTLPLTHHITLYTLPLTHHIPSDAKKTFFCSFLFFGKIFFYFFLTLICLLKKIYYKVYLIMWNACSTIYNLSMWVKCE